MTYRKNKREYFRIETDTVTRVLNMFSGSTIETTKNPIIMHRATDHDGTLECSEQEFNSAYKEAFDRIISLMKVL